MKSESFNLSPKLRAVVLLAILALMVTPVAFAQADAEGSGTVKGVVTDPAGTPLPGVTVSVADTNLFTITDGDGLYEISAVPVGQRLVEARLAGFKPAEALVQVPEDGTASHDFILQLDVLSMDQIVVTGAISPYEKIESSVAVTTQTAEQIDQKAPLNTTQLLEVVPGFWAESSGGEGGNNLFARGIPQDGSFRYVAMYEDGLPVFESPELAFTNIDLLMRVDDMIDSMEAVRGGSAAIFASNAPGGLVNFVNKTGGEIPEGAVKFTVGDYNLFRLDFTYGGPVGENWRYQVGGFYRTDDGIRDPGFPANRGGQIKLNLTRLLDNGYVRFNAKRMDERNIFYLPIPLQNPDDPTSIPGFDANFGTLTTNDAGLVKIRTPEGDLTRNLKDGMNPEVTNLGAEIFLELDNGWNVKNSTRFTDADVLFNAVFSLFNPADAELFAQNQLARVPGAVDYRYSFTHFPDQVFDVADANGNGLVVESGWWTVEKPLEMFVNDLRFTKQFENHAFTAGLYVSSYDVDETWSFNNILTEVTGAPRLLDLELLDAQGNVLTSVTQDGFTRFGDFHRNASSDVTLAALYLADEWQVTDNLRIDAGLRFETSDFSGNVEELGSFDLGDPDTLADDNVTWGTGLFLPFDHSFDDVGVSVGANYTITDNFAIYGRASDGFRQPDLEQWTDGNVREKGNSESIQQFEGGIKYSSPKVGAFAGLFFSQFDDVLFSDEVINPDTGQLETARRFASTETIGLEAEVIFQVVRNFQIGITTTLQQPEYRDFVFTRGGQTFDFDGNQVRRIPEVLFSIRPSYRIGRFGIFGSWNYIDERFSDDANNTTLPEYDKLDAGVSYDLNERVTLDLRGTNLTNSVGLTEGNPRVGQIIGIQQDIFMARPILGRAFRGSVTLRF